MTAITHLIQPRAKDIGDFEVRRALPYIKKRSVGPWVFFDHFGPVTFEPGQEGINVRPHPHINLATVTYLFEGEIYHRDTLGNALPIQPGAINLMVAGKGIAHSERTRDELKRAGQSLHGLQLWHALPEEAEEVDPAFYHYPADDIPEAVIEDCKVRVMMGEAYGLKSPVKTYSPILYVEADMPDDASLQMPEADELAVYVVKGEGQIGDEVLPINSLAVLEKAGNLTAKGPTRLAIIGGAPLGKRHLWWNFVSSRKERIEQAKDDWKSGRFGTVPGDADDFIPLPDNA